MQALIGFTCLQHAEAIEEVRPPLDRSLCTPFAVISVGLRRGGTSHVLTVTRVPLICNHRKT